MTLTFLSRDEWVGSSLTFTLRVCRYVFQQNRDEFATLFQIKCKTPNGWAYPGSYLRVLLLPPWRDAGPSQGYPPSSMSPVPIYTPGWRETKWSKFPCIKETTRRARLGPRTSRSAVRGVNRWPPTLPSLPDNNYTNRDPVPLVGPVNTRGLRNFAPKFELRKIRDYGGVRENRPCSRVKVT